MKHLQKFESSWRSVELERNEEMYNFISETIVEFQENHRLKIYNDDNETTIMVVLPGVSMDSMSIKKDIKGLISDSDNLASFLKEVDYLVEKICSNEEIEHSARLTDRELVLAFYWQHESPF